MIRLSAVVGLALLGLAILVNGGASQDKKDTPKIKGMLPPGWKDLKLSDAQKKSVYQIQSAFKAKQEALEEQMRQLRLQERVEMVKVLNDEQKALLRKLTTGDDGTPAKETSKERKPTGN